ncbi:MAG: hypothetical protein JNJ77_05470 [Planctomycetia bacterium]|nr:hypothetical protein [Planctomycetia bacterium]
MNTKPPPLKKPRLRWWRLLGCLFLSLFLWWGVGQLLEPRPVWSIDSREGKSLLPLVEQENGHYLLAVEVFHKAGTYSRNPLALVVIDKNSGKVLHRLDTGDSSLLKYDQINCIPRIHGDVIWWLAITEILSGFEYRLCAWRYKKENMVRTVHIWQDSILQQMRLQWPAMSKVIAIHHKQNSLESKVWNRLMNSLLSLSLGMECNVLFPEIPPLFETWQLPETPDHKLQRICQWPVPADRIDAAWEMSEDGNRLVVLEPPGNSSLARQRALASGKEKFQGKELYDLYRSEARGMQVYDTSSGRCLHHYQDEYVPYVSWGWRGSYLITGVVNTNHITEELTLTDLLRRDIEWIPTRVDLLKPFQRYVYRINEQCIQPVKMTTAFRDTGVQFAFVGKIFHGSIRTWNSGISYLLGIDEDHLNLLQQLHFSESNSSIRYTSFAWLPGWHGQYITSSTNSWLKYISSWKYKWKWFERLYDKLEEQSWIKHSVTTVCDATRQQPFSYAVVATAPQCFSMLFLHKFRMQDVKTVLGSTLHSYELPMHIHSPWWARVAALIPWLWLIWIRFRSSHQK